MTPLLATVGVVVLVIVGAVVVLRRLKNPHSLARTGMTKKLRNLLDIAPQLLDAPDRGGETPLMHAAKFDEREIVSLLLEKGANPNAACDGGGTALMMAASFGYSEIVRDLLRGGADPDVSDADGVTAIHYAAAGGHTDAVRALLDVGADRSMKDAAGRTAEKVAEEAGHEAATLMLRYGA